MVTGAGSVGPGWGNGKASAVLYAREGAKVYGVDCNLAAAEETKAIIDREGGKCVAPVSNRCDVFPSPNREEGVAARRVRRSDTLIQLPCPASPGGRTSVGVPSMFDHPEVQVLWPT